MQEARERVRSAIRNAGFEFPLRRITVNLAPADVRKQGPLYDLPIAVAILVASQQVPDRFEEMALLGELSLDGHLRHVNGVLPLVSMCADLGIATAVVPPADVAEARLAETVEVRGLGTLAEVREGPETWRVDCAAGPAPPAREQTAELAVIRGQEHVKRALEVAAAGGHNVMLQGPPGAGKTLLARGAGDHAGAQRGRGPRRHEDLLGGGSWSDGTVGCSANVRSAGRCRLRCQTRRTPTSRCCSTR